METNEFCVENPFEINEPECEPFIRMCFPVEYVGFTEFYDENKLPIYRNTLLIFKELITSESESLVLHIEAMIGGSLFFDNMVISKKKKDMLIDAFIPYYEQEELYEECDEIIEIHKKLSN